MDKDDEEELRNLAKTVTSQQEAESSTLENLEDVIDKSSHGKIHDMLLEMEKNSLQIQ